MRIIKEGTKPKPVYRGTCLRCGCVFEEDAEKLRIESDRNESFARVTCPQCSSAALMYPVRQG